MGWNGVRLPRTVRIERRDQDDADSISYWDGGMSDGGLAMPTSLGIDDHVIEAGPSQIQAHPESHDVQSATDRIGPKKFRFLKNTEFVVNNLPPLWWSGSTENFNQTGKNKMDQNVVLVCDVISVCPFASSNCTISPRDSRFEGKMADVVEGE